MALRILFIDDVTKRLAKLHALLDGAGVAAEVTHRRHVEAVRLPDDVAGADVVFFDFDLCAGDDENSEPCPVTGNLHECRCPNGLELARRIVAAGCPARRAVVHSATWREDLRDEMVRLLAAAGWPVVVENIRYWPDNTAAYLARHFGLTE